MTEMKINCNHIDDPDVSNNGSASNDNDDDPVQQVEVEKDIPGSLLMSIADGHVHVQSIYCGKVHDILRSIILDNL
jgi:hypothetical protein